MISIVRKNIMRKYFLLLPLVYFSLVSKAYSEDYRWIITYPNATNDWGTKVACGENKLVLKAQFIALTSRNDYKLITFAVRPTTSYTSSWLIESIQLWLNTDNYPGSIDPDADSLVSSLDTLTILPQSVPTNRVTFTLPAEGLSLSDTTTLFVTMLFRDLHDTIPDNREISDQSSATFGIYLSRTDNDIIVTPSNLYSNNWSTSTSQMYTLWAKNLPIIIFNQNKSAEEDSFRFYPRWRALDHSPASKEQQLTDYTFQAYVNLPHSNLISSTDGDLLSYASFKLSWDNTILQLDSMAFGDIWDGKQFDTERSGFGEVTIDPLNPRYSTIRFEGVVSVTEQAIPIDYNNLAVFYFRVIKPGVSPLWLSDITLLDQWGIKYHHYRSLHNNLSPGERYDAWVKFILGDYAGAKTEITAGYGDGKIGPLDDLSLFSNYLWLSKDSSRWNARFDVGSPTSHDPDELCPDDTTNFYDLLIIGANYYRTYQGELNQKIVVSPSSKARLTLIGHPTSLDGQRWVFTLKANQLSELAAAHVIMQFAPQQWRLVNVCGSHWLRSQAPQHLLLTAPQPLSRGYLDVNLLLLPRPLIGDGDLLTLEFERLQPATSPPILLSADLRKPNYEKIEYVYLTEELAPIPQNLFLVNVFPNPFNSLARIKYAIPQGHEGIYQLAIYDLNGQLVRQCSAGYHNAGYYEFNWNGKNTAAQEVASGIYILQLSGNNFLKRQKISLIR